jgi:molybdopterin-guanine dinucleotide biosynthesis protein A
MGVDKSSLVVGGRPLLDHMLHKLAALGLRSRIAGLTDKQGVADHPAIADERTGCGPVGGLETALRYSQSAFVIVLGVDLPLVSTGLLKGLLTRAEWTGAMATIPRALGRPQPLCAVYRKELSEPVRRLRDEGAWKLMYGIGRAVAETGGRMDLFDIEMVTAAGSIWTERPAVWEFLNCNTPDDVALAERLLASRTHECEAGGPIL